MTTTTMTGTWTVETPLRAGFAARHLGFGTVHGTIAVTGGTVEFDAGGRPVRLEGTLDPASIDTGNPRRDKDLRGRRFLDVAHHPRMELTAGHIEPTGAGWRANAVLRVAGAEAPLWIDGTLDGLSVTGTARLDLRDAGIRAPGFLVGRHVALTISARLVRPDAEAS